MYSWATMNNFNDQLAFAEVEKDQGVYSEEQMEEMFSDGFNDMVEKMQAQYKDSCVKWDLNESLFELPTGVDFEEV